MCINIGNTIALLLKKNNHLTLLVQCTIYQKFEECHIKLLISWKSFVCDGFLSQGLGVNIIQSTIIECL